MRPTCFTVCLLVGIVLASQIAFAEDAGSRTDQVPAAFVSNSYLDVLWLTQHIGLPDAVRSSADIATKARIAKAMTADNSLTVKGASSLMTADTFARLAGADGKLDPSDVQEALAAQVPASRKQLFPKVADHLALLTTSLDLIDEPHRVAERELVDWIVENYSPDKPLGITAVCTGNSRRSVLAATMINAAAVYYGLTEIHGYSGGTKPSAFNPRTIATLRAAGFEVEPTGREAPRGDEATQNPIYTICWGQRADGEKQGTTEFSKRYDDPHNPQSGFAALLVCSEADSECPSVQGASIRIPIPYFDPKSFDGTSFEAQKYAERRDDIGRLMVSVMMQARLRLIAAGRLNVESAPR